MANILLIDDCEEMRDMVSDMLEDAGFKVFTAESSEAAEEICKLTNFSLILCDLVMPVSEFQELSASMGSAMAGVHTVHKLATRYPKVPVVAISGALVGEPLETIRQFGARAVLSKPFGREELLRTVGEAIGCPS